MEAVDSLLLVWRAKRNGPTVVCRFVPNFQVAAASGQLFGWLDSSGAFTEGIHLPSSVDSRSCPNDRSIALPIGLTTARSIWWNKWVTIHFVSIPRSTPKPTITCWAIIRATLSRSMMPCQISRFTQWIGTWIDLRCSWVTKPIHFRLASSCGISMETGQHGAQALFASLISTHSSVLFFLNIA